jgi:RNA polymerase sigma-70 factor (ECF subfamily)
MEASFMTRARAAPAARPARPGPAAEPGPGAFERFFREHHPAVVGIALRVTGDAQAAEDVAQDVFISALRRFPDQGEPDYDPSGHAAAWIRAAAVHTGLNAIRGERRRDRRQQLGGIEAGPAAPASPEEAVLDRESAAEVRRALTRLPRRSAAVLVLRHSGLSYAEVAEALHVKVGQVGTMLRRAESALRKELSDESRH